jgi:hypothetical protein
MMMLAKPSVALGFGVFFLCAIACTHSSEMFSGPLWLLPDWVAGLAVVVGAVVSKRDWNVGRPYQVAAWAFMLSLLLESFLRNLEEWMDSSPADVGTDIVSLPHGAYLASIAVLGLVALGALIATLRARADARP